MKKIDEKKYSKKFIFNSKSIRIIIFISIFETKINYSKNFKILFIKRKRCLKYLNYNYKFDLNTLYANIKYLFYKKTKALFNIEIYKTKKNAIKKINNKNLIKFATSSNSS